MLLSKSNVLVMGECKINMAKTRYIHGTKGKEKGMFFYGEVTIKKISA
jgi:hypothetical protein